MLVPRFPFPVLVTSVNLFSVIVDICGFSDQSLLRFRQCGLIYFLAVSFSIPLCEFDRLLELLQLVISLGQCSTSRTFDISTELERTYSQARKTSTTIQHSLHILFNFKVVLSNLFRLRKGIELLFTEYKSLT